MKPWVKVLGVVVAIFFIVVVTAVVYVKTLDLNKLIPQIQTAIKQQTGRDFSVGDASLDISFDGGLVLNLSKLTLSDDPAVAKQHFVSVEQVDVSLNWMRYITNKEVALGQIVLIEPVIRLIRIDDGRFNFTSLLSVLDQGKTPSSSTQQAAGAMPLLLIDTLKVENATVFFEDRSSSAPERFYADQIDMAVQDFSLMNPFRMEVVMRALATAQNVMFASTLQLNVKEQRLEMSDMTLEVLLRDLDLDAMTMMVPEVRQLRLKEKPLGTINASVARASVGANGLADDVVADVVLKDGFINTAFWPMPLEKVSANMKVSMNDVHVDNMSLSTGKSLLSFKGAVLNYLNAPSFNGSVHVDDFDLAMLADVASLPFPLKGAVDVEASLEGEGFEPSDLMSSLSSEGDLQSTAVVIERLNVLSKVFQKIDFIPGLTQKLYVGLPEQWQDVLGRDNTIIEPMTTSWTIKNGQLTVPDLDVPMEGFRLRGQNITMAIDQQYTAQVQLVFEPALAADMVRSVEEMAVLVEEDGTISLPGTLKGVFPERPSLLLDRKYLTRNLVEMGTKKIIEKVIDNNPEAGRALEGILQGVFD